MRHSGQLALSGPAKAAFRAAGRRIGAWEGEFRAAVCGIGARKAEFRASAGRRAALEPLLLGYNTLKSPEMGRVGFSAAQIFKFIIY